jgi:cellulose synthase/poly-beta-1,6-N-acetylglucosamine synthase-like glycosyltransferase
MPDALPRPARVAVVPCYNEGRNPIDLASVLTSVPDLDVLFVDDASDPQSRQVLSDLASGPACIHVRQNADRAGKVQSLLNVIRGLDPATQKILLVDCDVDVSTETLQTVLGELDRADLVLVNAKAIQKPRTVWERGAIFSANRHDRLRNRYVKRYPARCTNGRLLGMSRRLVDAIVRSDVPRHTEDAHFMLVCLKEGFTFSYLHDAVLQYRAPDTLADYLRQSNRFSEGRSLLRERWSNEVLAKYYDLRAGDVLGTLLAEAARDPLGAAVFAYMLAAKVTQRKDTRSQNAAWSVATSTKALR